MRNDKKNLVKIFETERWLYAEGSLENKRKNFWDVQIKNSTELKKLLSDAQKFSCGFTKEIEAELKGNKFNEILDNVFRYSSQNFIIIFLNKLFFIKRRNANFSKLKLAFAVSALIIIAAALFSLQQPKTKHKINAKLLAWNDKSFYTEINSAEFEFADISHHQIKQYIQYQLSNDKWLQDVVSLQQEIDKLNSTINNKSL